MPDRPLSPREQRRKARELRRRMEELDRLDAAYGLGARTRATPRHSLGLNTAISVAFTSVVVTLLVLFLPSSPMESVRRTLGLGPERGLPAPPIEERGGVFAFTMTQQGSDEPVGWDPCEPIRYQVNPTDEPAGGSELATT